MPKRIFIAFAKEDAAYRTLLASQAKNKRSPFEFVDMSVKQPWDSEWKTNCRKRVKGCDGMIALISRNTKNADGERWEIECARSEGVPVMFMWIDDKRPALPAELENKRINVWSWPNIDGFLSRL